ncbi:TIGR03936 family radical SAM-associated protein [Clostridium aestuarii]|uniref:TIGR03936 family radical SAM-associated protein n=1 Tax=Clostridium aestuarii TaxID=338193 RepID=A0ABT4CZ78_9CLOT|nr:TIGR03936 family radical SAM-associated protein [Clostridium aestuarii]MCY6484289.1 TIGR03936 family radical SAM-associated protein [Clostridium aestuarii]
MRYLIKFTKDNSIKYISHLELMRTIHRMIRRAELPVEYSKGFNPHIILSIAQPLSVGVYSKGEYMDLNFNEETDEKYIKKKLNENVPTGIKILDVIKVREKINNSKVPQAMAAIEAAEYELVLKCNNTKNIVEKLKELVKKKEWNIIKKGKKGEKEINIKPMIKNFKYKIQEDELKVKTLVACGSKENLSAQLLGQYIKNNMEDMNKDSFIHIERQEMFACESNKFVSLDKYFKQ